MTSHDPEWMHELVQCNMCGCTMTRGGLMTGHMCPQKRESAARGHAFIKRLSAHLELTS
jgi:hypothetical protein